MAVTGLKKNYRKLSLKGLAYTMRFFVHGRQTKNTLQSQPLI